MRLGIRSAISALVLTSIVVSAVGVHLLWWRTAQQVSQTLADTINEQIVSAVGDELQSVTTEARSSMLAVRTLLAEKVFDPRDARKREVVFQSQLLSQPTISWVAFGWPDGSFFAGHKLGDGVIEMLEITPDRKMRINRYEFVGNDLQLKNTRVEDTDYSVTDQEWFRVAIETNDEHWSTLTTHPSGERLAAAFAAPIEHRPEARRRHRHHHRTDAGLEFPVAAHGRKIGRRFYPRAGRQGGRRTRSERQRSDGAENRSSAVSGRGRRDPEAAAPTSPAKASRFTTHGDAGRQGLSGGADADLVSRLVAGDCGARVGISRTGADDDPEFADRPCGADRVCRAVVGMAGAAPDRRAPDQGGRTRSGMSSASISTRWSGIRRG